MRLCITGLVIWGAGGFMCYALGVNQVIVAAISAVGGALLGLGLVVETLG